MHRQILRAPRPPAAVAGLEGMRVADEILKLHNAVGLLIGGLAKEIWKGESRPEKFAEHKDVDVLVLSRECDHHPGQFEHGVDWWVRHEPYELPTNGSSIGIIWQLSLVKPNIAAGLYLPPVALLRESIEQEFEAWGKAFVVKGRHDRYAKTPGLTTYAVLPIETLNVNWGHRGDDVARHCQPC
jgi:hypothetical protein